MKLRRHYFAANDHTVIGQASQLSAAATIDSAIRRVRQSVRGMLLLTIASVVAQQPEAPLDLSSQQRSYKHLAAFFDKESPGTTAVELPGQKLKYVTLETARWHKIKRQSIFHFYYHSEKVNGPRTAFLVEAYRVYGYGIIKPQQTVSVFRNWAWPGDDQSKPNPFPYAQDTRLSVDAFKACHAKLDLAKVNDQLKQPWHAKINQLDTLDQFRYKITNNIFESLAPGKHVEHDFLNANPGLLPQQTWRLIAYKPNELYNGSGSTVPFDIQLHGNEKYVVFRTITPNSEDDPYYF